MSPSTFVAVVFLALLIVGGIIHIIKGLVLGKISIGYKYFGNTRSFTRQKEALGYYATIGIYLIGVIVCVFFIEFVISKNV